MYVNFTETDGEKTSFYVNGDKKDVTFLMNNNIAVTTNDSFLIDFRNIFRDYQIVTLIDEKWKFRE